MKSIPVWALKRQHEMETSGMIPKFKIGDIVMVAETEDMFSGVGIIQYVSDGDSGSCEYDIDFGSKSDAWHPEANLTMIKKSI